MVSVSPSHSAERDPTRPWVPSPFSRLARVQAASVAGDALFAIGLAGSVFFSLDFSSARWRVALYLVLTIAPFAIAAPVVGPAIDRIRGGRRWIIVGSMAMRTVLAFFVVRHMDSLLFYPEAFGMLVMQKVYSISKSAVVPGTVHSDEELVEANSKLTVLSALAVVAAAIPGGILLKLGGGAWSVALGGVIFAIGTIVALQLPPTTVAVAPPGESEREELRSAGIVHASSAMSLIRGIVGFLAFMLAFEFKSNGSPLWQLGLVAACAQLGFFVGAILAPRIRKLLSEERILISALGVTVVGGVLSALLGGLGGAAFMSMLVGATGSAAKQAFDSIVQRDAPDANRGRTFAKFETRFQLVWVIGALIPILKPIPASVGFALIALVASFAMIGYLIGLRNLRRGQLPVARRGLLRRRVVVDGASTDAGVAIDGLMPDELLSDAERQALEEERRERAELLGFSTDTNDDHDGTLVFDRFAGSTADATVVEESSTFDPARRWMRRSSTSAAAVTSEAAAAVTSEADNAGTGDMSERTPASEESPGIGQDHRQRGLLFEPEAWENPGVPPS
ncbi:2A0121, H+ Antiporter protein [Acidimicrobiia bacterium]